MRERFAVALKDATMLQDKRRMSTLRLINAAIKDRDIAARGTGKGKVSDEEILQILAKMVKQRQESSRMYDEAARADLAMQEREEIGIISLFLPYQLSVEEMTAACHLAISEMAAQGLRDMGKCISWLKEKYAGQMDFTQASRLIRDMLSK